MISRKLYISVLSATLISGFAIAEPEVTGKFTHEQANYTSSGTTIGAANSHNRDAFKSESSLRVYVDGSLDDEAGSSYHLELQGFNDGKAVGNLDSNEEYTQRDPLREA